ncbi:MAG: nuclear transport factor 2 family protein [Thermoleophilaceae bacterium]
MDRVAAIRQAIEAFGRRDFEMALERFDPQVEWHPASEDPDAMTRYGHAGVAEHFTQWTAAFDDLQGEVEAAREQGDEVVVLLHYWGHGSESGVEIDDRVWQVFTFRGERIVRVEESYERPSNHGEESG